MLEMAIVIKGREPAIENSHSRNCIIGVRQMSSR
jgi:hypothetical protein